MTTRQPKSDCCILGESVGESDGKTVVGVDCRLVRRARTQNKRTEGLSERRLAVSVGSTKEKKLDPNADRLAGTRVGPDFNSTDIGEDRCS